LLRHFKRFQHTRCKQFAQSVFPLSPQLWHEGWVHLMAFVLDRLGNVSSGLTYLDTIALKLARSSLLPPVLEPLLPASIRAHGSIWAQVLARPIR
jgi:hypothetical protein